MSHSADPIKEPNELQELNTAALYAYTQVLFALKNQSIIWGNQESSIPSLMTTLMSNLTQALLAVTEGKSDSAERSYIQAMVTLVRIIELLARRNTKPWQVVGSDSLEPDPIRGWVVTSKPKGGIDG